MKRPLASLLVGCVFVGVTGSSLLAQAPAPTPDENPTGNTGALKEQIQTAGSYDAHSGNATRIANDLHLPGALGVYGLDFTRYWNSLHPDLNSNPNAEWPEDFGATGWSHSWRWTATEGTDIWQTEEGGGAEGTQYWETSITIGFPDGHNNKYKIVRANRSYPGQPPECAGRIGWGAPYLAQCGERDWPTPGQGVHDRLSDMAEDGSNFWLHLADGGSVHFVGGSGGYQATEVFDPHGLRTALSYDANGYLYRVEQEGGRWLDLIWDYRAGFPFKVIVQVQSGGYAGTQSVFYNYNPVSNGNATFLVLTSVAYPDDPAPGQTASAVYTYGFAYGDDPDGEPRAPYPLLKVADDPRHPGAMTKIRYRYRGVTCPERPPGPYNPNYFRAFAEAIGAEESGETTIAVSSFSIDCYDGTRMETNGLNGWRMFYFGSSAGPDPGTQGFGCLGYQLAKLTDFTNQFPLPGNLPFEQQNFMDGQPRQVWDGRGILTELVATPYNPTSGETGDDSGQPAEIHHTEADGSVHYYDRINAGSSEQRDPSRIHNPFHHWLYSQTDERGFTTTYVRDSRMRAKDIVYPVTGQNFTYNDWNQVTSHTLASAATVTYEYDPTTQRLLREYNSIDGWDARKEYIYDDPSHPDLVHKVIDGRARSSGAPYSTRIEYNGRNRIIEVHYAPTGANPDPTVRYEYDAYGNCTSITDELGHTSFYSYDAYRRCIRSIEPLNALDWKGTETVASRTWDWIYDRWIDGVGQRDASAHTKNEWRIQIEPAFNAACDRRMTARAHDLQNRIVIESTGWIQPCNQPIGNWYWSPTDGENHYFSYDENGQKKSFTDPQGRLTTYDYDLRNRLWKTNETVNTIPRTTETLYDVTGNKTDVIFPDTRTQQWRDYDPFGQPGRFIDERGNTTNLTYVWGPMKKLYTVTTHRDKDGGGTEDQQTTFSYDLMGKPTQVLFPDGSHEDSTYEFDQLKTWRTRKGQTKTIVYDPRGREQSHTWDDGVTPAISRSWDDANRLSSIANIFSSIDFAYDDAGQMIWEGDEIAGSGGRTQTNYFRYLDGSVAHLHYPGGHYVRHDYTSRGQLAATGWDDDENNWWMQLAHYTYLFDGKVDKVDYGNGTTSDPNYDPRGFISSVQHKRTATGEILASHSYTRDTRDRIVSLQKGYNPGANPMENGRGDRFRYDEEGQLVESWYNATDPANSGAGNTRYDGFAYDALGNRTQNNFVASRGSTSFIRRDNGLNQYSSWTPSIIYHDDNSPWAPWTSFPGNGMLMADGWLVASYNALNQPVAMVPFGWSDAIYFGYDPLGRCVKRWVGSSGDVYSNPATYFHYDGWNLLQEGNNAWGPARVYVPGNRVDEIVWSYNTFTGEEAFHHYDARSHCILLTDRPGYIREQYDYDAFGQPYFYDASGNSIGSYDAQGRWAGYSLFGNRFLFTGREWIPDLKLYDYRNRMYQPELGRFMQPDPKHFKAGDYNLYRYCHNDPVNRNDPFGLIDREIDKDLDKKGVEASQNALKAAKDAGDHTGRSQAVQEKDGKRSLASKIAKGSPKTEKRMIGGRMQTVTTQTEEAPVDPGHTPVGVGHAHMDKTGKGDPNFSKADKDTARGSKGEPGIPVYKVNESNPSQILRLTPQVDYHDEPTIRPVP